MNTQVIRYAVQTRAFAVVTASVVAGAGSAAVTYLVVNKRLKRKYEELSASEIQEAKNHFRRLYKADEYADISSVLDHGDEEEDEDLNAPIAEALAESIRIMSDHGYTDYRNVVVTSDIPVEGEPVVEVVGANQRNVFANPNSVTLVDGFDQAAEDEKKVANRPYILTSDEFYENEKGREQLTLTYFQADDTLVDEKDTPIPNYESLLGPGNLRFGYGTKEKDVVLIHNPATNRDYEVTRSRDSYSFTMFGYEPETDRKPVQGRAVRDDD